MTSCHVGRLLIATFLVTCDVDAVSRLLRRGKHGMMGAPSAPPDIRLPSEQWFTQQLDNFDPTNTQTWQQKYYVRTDYHVGSGPVFLMIGGEGKASPAWMVLGNWIEYAETNKALMFEIEHRYYGNSKPTSDLSVENLRYLTSEQALADIANFVIAMNDKYKLPQNTKWIAFGGSYSGNLAAWVRVKYPHLIHGAMSASGPVLAKVDFFEYMNVVRNSLAFYKKSCPKAVERADQMVNQLMKTPDGQKTINSMFRLCDPINVTNPYDVQNLLESLADNFASIVQYNKIKASRKNLTIDAVCKTMLNKKLGNPVVRYAAINSLLLDTYGESCLDYKYDKMIEMLKNTSWELGSGRQWVYQTCTEFGYYQTSEKRQELFGHDFPLKFFLQQCWDIYGNNFTKDMVFNGVRRTNTMYGGLDLQATRVVYVQGSIDPWHALGVTHTRLPESPAIFIRGTAHCASMYPARTSDPPALIAARKKVGQLIQKWLKEK